LVSKGWLGWIFTHYDGKPSINDEVALPKVVSRAACSKKHAPVSLAVSSANRFQISLTNLNESFGDARAISQA